MVYHIQDLILPIESIPSGTVIREGSKENEFSIHEKVVALCCSFSAKTVSGVTYTPATPSSASQEKGQDSRGPLQSYVKHGLEPKT
ncbi:hypothetical protein TNCV_3758881 [Trichonephila clavipes]|nr:hypothetical protein TNCV_3758881 [Trichonephila clavipes]